MSQTQQKMTSSQSISPEESPAPTIEQKMGEWEPYLSLIKDWQHADEICARAVERAKSAHEEEKNRALGKFGSEKSNLESTRKERIHALEAERRAAKESADRLLTQAKSAQTKIRQAMETVGLETLMDDIEVSSSPERGDASMTLSSLRDIVADSLAIENSLQDDLFALRAARQRQSAQMWGVGIGLWLVAVLVFAPYSLISTLLVGLAVFVMATPRKIETSEALRPSFASHLGHCLSLLTGKQQVMQYPFSLVEKGRTVSGNAMGGAIASSLLAWVFFTVMRTPLFYSPAELLRHLIFVLGFSSFTGFVTFALANQDITLVELNEGSKNKVLK